METIEQQLFSWDDWNDIDVGVFYFYGVMLKVQIGNFPPGTLFDHAVFDMQQSVVELYDEAYTDTPHRFRLLLSVGDQLQ